MASQSHCVWQTFHVGGLRPAVVQARMHSLVFNVVLRYLAMQVVHVLSDDDAVVPVSGAEASPSKSRRKMQFERLDEVSFGTEAFSAKLRTRPAQELVRDAGRRWAAAQEPAHKLGEFSTPRQSADDYWITTAKCFKHTDCRSGNGKVFQFRGCWGQTGGVFMLQVASCGDCSGGDRVARVAQKHTDNEISVEKRMLVLAARADLLQTGRKATPSAVKIRLQDDTISKEKVRLILRHCRQSLGQETRAFRESQVLFEQHVSTIDSSLVLVHEIQTAPVFQWVALLPAFLSRLAALQPSRWFCTGDFTFRLEHMGYAYGVLRSLAA